MNKIDQLLLLSGTHDHQSYVKTLAIFPAILAAISNRPCKLLAIIAAELPVVYTDDLKSP